MAKLKQSKKDLELVQPTKEVEVQKIKLKKKPVTVVQTLKDFFVFPRYDYQKNSAVILSCDPGIKNFAFVLMEVPITLTNIEEVTVEDVIAFLKSIRIVDCGFLKSCLTELRQDNLIPYLSRFRKDNQRIFSSNPDYLVLERYQSRDLRGPRNEVINFNICNVINNLFNNPSPLRNTRLFIAAQWKRYFNIDKTEAKVKGLDLVYDAWKKDRQLRKILTDHQTDAFLIGVYHSLELLLDGKKDAPDIREAVVTYLIKNTANYFRTYFKEIKTYE